MKGFRTDEKGRWSPAYRCEQDEDNGMLLILFGVVCLLLFVIIFLRWWVA